MATRTCGPILVAVVAIILLSGCTSIRQALQNKPCVLDANIPYHVVAVDAALHELALYWRDPQLGTPFATIRRLNAWLEAGEDSVIAVTNAGIYKRDLTPLGLYIERGIVLSPINLADGYGNFYLKPNGVFYLTTNGTGIADASELEAVEDSLIYAIQSGPLLLLDNQIHPAFTPGSANCRLRSGIGVADDGTVYVAISNGAVNFYDFATFFRDSLGTADALYLDGAISALYAPHLGLTKQPKTHFGAFLVVRHKE